MYFCYSDGNIIKWYNCDFAHRVLSLIIFATAHLNTTPKAFVWAAKGTILSQGTSWQREIQGWGVQPNWGVQRAQGRAQAQSHHPQRDRAWAPATRHPWCEEDMLSLFLSSACNACKPWAKIAKHSGPVAN